MQIGSSFATPSIVHHELYPAIGFDATVVNNKPQRGQELLHGSFAQDGTIAWICTKNYLQIFNLSIFKRTHLISFKDEDDELMEINVAAEVHIQHRQHLLVSARVADTHAQSTLYLIDARTGCVVSQVQFNHVITALLVLRGKVPPHFTLPLLLGTLGGHVLLADLAKHVPHARMQVQHVTAAEYDGTVPPNTVPVMVVNASAVTGEHVQYPTSRDQVTLLKRSTVSVTALVESQHGVLVGFNFGCVQLWSLTSFTCHLASDLHEHIKSATSSDQYSKPPVTGLAVQRLGTEEWLWVTRGSCHTSTCHHESSSNIALYHLSRDQDTRLECEFQRVLVGNNNKYSHVIGMQTLDQGSDRPQVMFVWETLPLRDFEWQITRHVELFDWQSTGLAQPALFKSYPLKIDAPQSRDQLSGLACWVNPMTVREFHRHVTLDHVTDSHGVALSCTLHVLTPRAVSILSYQSHAEQLLTKIAQRGASGLTNFGQFYTWACDQGLCARSEDEVTRLMNYWDMLLEHNLIAVLADYITHRSMDHEYTLTNTKIIFDWLSRAYAKLGARIEQITVTALKSPLHTDERQHEEMSRWFVLIIDLLALLQSLASRRDISAEHMELLNDKSRDMFSTSQTLEIVLWCVSHALVDPAVRTSLVNLDGQIKQRRKDRQQRHYRHFWTIKNMTRVNLSTEQQTDQGDGTKLFIDLLWESMTATSTQESDHVSSYPPSSLSALVEVFQRTHADLIVKKRCVLLYLLHDLQLSPALIEDCAQSFMIDQDYQLLTRALWLLDTQQFSEAVALLTGGTRHGAKIELEQWTRLIVKTLHDYEQYALALRVITANNYLQSHLLIGHQSRDQITGTDDVITYIDVLLYNNLLHQAFNAVRAISRTTREGSYDAVLLETLLYHLYQYCHAHNKLDVLFELPLDSIEDKYLVEFLQRSPQSRDAQYLLVYYLQRGRVSDAVQCHHELLKKHVTDPNQTALVENYLLTLPAVQRRALTAVNVAPVKVPAAVPETPKSAVKRHVPRLFNTPGDSVTASPSTFKRPSHVSHVAAASVNSPIRPRKSLALLAPTAVRLTGGPRMSLTGVKSSRMSLGGPSRRQSLIGLLTAPADTPVTPVTSNYGVKTAEESPRDSELKQRTPFKQVRPQSPPQSPLQQASTTLQQTLRRMEDVKPAPAAVVVDLDSDDDSEHVTPAAKNNNNNAFTKLSSESSLFSESSEHSDGDDADMQDDHVSDQDHVSDEVLSEESDHVINDAPIEELSSDEDDVSSKVSKPDLSEHVSEHVIDQDEQNFDDNQAWINNYVPRATSTVQDTMSRDIPDNTDHVPEVPVNDMEDIPPVTSTFDFVEQFTAPDTDNHVPENEHVNMSVDQGEESSASQSRVSKAASSPHQSREEQSASMPAEDESAEEVSVNDSVNQSVNQSLVSREDKCDSVNQSVNQSHDEHSDEEPRTRESLGGTIRRSSRLQQTPKPQYNFNQKLSKRKTSKKDETAEPVVSETPAKLRRAAARVNDPLTKAKTKRMTKRK